MNTRKHRLSVRFLDLAALLLALAASGCGTGMQDDAVLDAALTGPYEPFAGGVKFDGNGSPGVSESMLYEAFCGNNNSFYATVGVKRSNDPTKVDLSPWAANLDSNFLTYFKGMLAPNLTTEFFDGTTSIGYSEKILSDEFNYVEPESEEHIAKIWAATMLYTNSNIVSLALAGQSINPWNNTYYINVPAACTAGNLDSCLDKQLYLDSREELFEDHKLELALVVDHTSKNCSLGRRPSVTAFISDEVANTIESTCGIDMGIPADVNAAVEARICSSTAYGASECDGVVDAVHRMDDYVAGSSTDKYCIGSTNSLEKDKLTCRETATGTQYDVVYTMIYLPHVETMWCPP